MKEYVERWVLCLLICGTIVLGCGACAAMWRAVKKSAPAAIGGTAGAFVGGPLGAGVGSAAGSAIGDAVGENDDLRSGELVGEGALAREVERQAVLIAALRGDIQGTRDALKTLAGKSEQEVEETKSKTHWLTWVVLLVGGLVVLKWWRTLKADFYKARNAGLPVLQSLIHSPEAVEHKQGP